MHDPAPFTDADRADLVAYLDGELDPAGQQRVEARLGRDPRARAEADTLQRAWELLDYLPRPDPSPNFTEQTLTRVTALRTAASIGLPWYVRPALGIAGWAAALLFAVAFGYTVTPPVRPQPPPDLATDPAFTRQPQVIERLPLYLAVGNIEFLRALDRPELFDDDSPPRFGVGDDTRSLAARLGDPLRRARLQQYLAAYHGLSPERQIEVHDLDRDFQAEDPMTQARLGDVMERYASWLSHLPEEDFRRVAATPPGYERVLLVHGLLELQWHDSLPKAIADKPALVEKWRQDEAERQQRRLQALRAAEEAALLLPGLKDFRAAVEKYVKESLEPRLKPGERSELRNGAKRAPTYYFNKVLNFSETYGLTPPGPAEQWELFRQPRTKDIKPPS
jgi:anti-sigma factor RsiW